MTEIGIVLASVVVSGLIVRAAEKRWQPKHRLVWGLVPLSVSPLLTLVCLMISRLS